MRFALVPRGHTHRRWESAQHTCRPHVHVFHHGTSITRKEYLMSPSHPQQATPIGLIGLGQMGLPIARHLLDAGYHLRIFDLDPARLALLERHVQVTPVESVEEVATPGGIVLSIVPDDQALRHNVEALCPHLTNGIHLDLSTVAPQAARWAEETYTQAGLSTSYLSANMLGRPTLAESARLTILLSGAPAGRQRVL